MSLGLSFGTSKQKDKRVSQVDKTEVGTQAGTSASSQVTSGTQTGTQATTGTSTGTSTTTQTGGTTQVGTGSQQELQTSQLFSDPVLGGLEGAVTSLLTQVLDPSRNRAAISAGMSQFGDFDPIAFVEQGLSRAQSQQGSALDEILGGLFDAIGGRGSDNSAAALLENRARGEAASNLAGIEGQLSGQAQEIVRGNVLAANQVAGTEGSLLTDLINMLRGGKTTATGETQTETAEAGTQAQTGTTTTAEQRGEQQTSTQESTQVLLQMLEQLLNTNTRTTGTETSTGTTSKTGGGFSLGI